MTPIDIDELFELNPNYKVVEDGNIIIIDDWYKNFEEIQKIMKQQTPVRFEPDSHHGINENNFKDYYDCRIVLNLTKNNLKYINNIKEIQKITNLSLESEMALMFNYFKYINETENNIQAIPHIDGENILAGVIYIDDISSGGTAIYEPTPEDSDGAGVVDISDFSKRYNYKLARIIEAKPNRLVLYPGYLWHGAYIEDNKKYVDEWRINQVHFFKVEVENG